MFLPARTGFALTGSAVSAWFVPGEVVFRAGAGHLRLTFLGGRPHARPEGAGPLGARVNVLTGASAKQWRPGLPAYRGLCFRNVYPGIDARYEAHASRLKAEFVVAPGADPSAIRLAYGGAESVRIDDAGALRVRSGGAELVERAPEIYQETAQGRRQVQGAFRKAEDGSIGFRIGAYDGSQPLIVDPEIVYSSDLGGTRFDAATAIAVDPAGNLYVAGWTESVDFPAVSQIPGVRGSGVDAFVAKLDPNGVLVWATCIGGSGDDRALGIAVDNAGFSYVTGWTTSWDFPVVNGLQRHTGGGKDAFALKLSLSGDALAYSTYLGGSGPDSGNAIAVDGNGRAYIVGETASLNFPLQTPLQARNGGGFDAFVAVLDGSGSTLLFSTYLGGFGDDFGRSVAVTSAGNVLITGSTASLNFPVVNAVQPASGGGQHAFVACLAPLGTWLVYSTYLGGGGGVAGFSQEGRAIAADGAGNAYVAGVTNSSSFPVLDAYQAHFGAGGTDAFVAKFSAAGALVYSTYLGGASADAANAIAVDGQGDVLVAGQTASSDFPIADASQPALAGAWDAFVSKLSPDGTRLIFSTYFGGSDSDAANGVGLDAQARIYLAGQTLSANLPLTNAVQTANGGGFGGFVASVATGPNCSGVGPSGTLVTQTSGTLDLFAYGVHQASAVYFVTWSDVNGQDDIVWYPGVDLGGGTWKGSIDLSRHRPGNPDDGPFWVHVWMNGSAMTFCGDTYFVRDRTPRCTGVGPPGVVTTATSGTLDFYAYGVQNASAVYFPTWSMVNGQDDIVWYPGVDLGGGTWRASIDLSRHRPGNPDLGPFWVHVWMYGAATTFCGPAAFTRN